MNAHRTCALDRLCLAKTLSATRKGLIRELAVELCREFSTEKACSMTTFSRRIAVKCAEKGRWAYLSRRSSSNFAEDFRSERSGGEVITMMQPAESWYGYNFSALDGILFCFTARAGGPGPKDHSTPPRWGCPRSLAVGDRGDMSSLSLPTAQRMKHPAAHERRAHPFPANEGLPHFQLLSASSLHEHCRGDGML